jgi:hypothetical protein
MEVPMPYLWLLITAGSALIVVACTLRVVRRLQKRAKLIARIHSIYGYKG